MCLTFKIIYICKYTIFFSIWFMYHSKVLGQMNRNYKCQSLVRNTATRFGHIRLLGLLHTRPEFDSCVKCLLTYVNCCHRWESSNKYGFLHHLVLFPWNTAHHPSVWSSLQAQCKTVHSVLNWIWIAFQYVVVHTYACMMSHV